MKNLFKNAFFSFLKNKMAMGLLMVIIFLTTASFTLFNSTSQAFKKSYNNVVQQGNLHDFTIKEKYTLEGSEIYGEPQEQKHVTLQLNKLDKTSPNYVSHKGEDYIVTDPFEVTWKSKQYKIAFAQKISDRQNGSKDVTTIFNGKKGSWISSASLSDLDPTKLQSAKFDDHTISLDSKNAKFNFGTAGWLGGHDYDDVTTTKPLNEFMSDLDAALKSVFIKTPAEDFTIYSAALDSKSGPNYLESEKTTKGKYDFAVKTSDIVNAAKGGIDWTKSTANVYSTDGSKKIDFVKDIKTPFLKDVENAAAVALHQNTLNYLNKEFGDDISYKDVDSIYVTPSTSSFRFVNETEGTKVDKLQMFSGWQLPKTETKEDMLKELKAAYPGASGATLDNVKDKEFRMIYEEHGLVPKNYMISDYSSLAAVVSPSYAEEHNIKPLSKSAFNALVKPGGDFAKAFEADDFTKVRQILSGSTYSGHILWIENTPYIITGTGISPDFAYPIVDASNPIVNASNQAVLYVNNSGFGRIQDAFRNNTHEKYIAVKVNHGSTSKIFKEINDKLTTLMSWPSNMQATRMVDDTNEKYIMAPQRITFLTKLQNTIETLSWTVTALLAIFTAFIVGIVVKKQINGRKKQMGILMANGYSKWQVSTANLILGLIIASIPAILGYLFGHFMQFVFIGIFDNYWTLPIWDTQFSWITLVVTVVTPIIGISLLAFVITMWELRGSIVNLMNGISGKSSSRLAAAIMSPFRWMGIKTKLTISIFSTNVSRMVIALVSFTMAITVATVTFNTFGKFDYALEQSNELTDYEYQVDLASPTTEGGQYRHMTPEKLLDPKVMYSDAKANPTHALFDVPKETHTEKPVLHVPSGNDKTGQSDDIFFLKNKIEFKSLLNVFIGFGPLGANPWGIARKMMPENQKNAADERFKAFLEQTVTVVDGDQYAKQKQAFSKKAWYKDIADPKTRDYSKLSDDAHGLLVVDPGFLDFLQIGYNYAFGKYASGDRKVHLPFLIAYDNVITDSNDEEYTYIESDNTYKNYRGDNTAEILKVRGLNPDSKHILLSSHSKNALANFDEKGFVPIVINKYFAKTHSASVGSSFTSILKNHADRYQDTKERKIKYKVVSIENSYDQGRIFTSRKFANEAIGLDPTKGFNGIYSSNKDELLFRNTSLYSESGLYLGSDTINPDDSKDPAYQAFSKYLTSNHNTMDADPASPEVTDAVNPRVKGKSADDAIIKFGQIYSFSPLVLAYSSVDWALATDYEFHSVLELSSKILWLVEGITIFIAMLFVALISSMIVSDNKKFIATLKVMGYRSREISMIFLRTFIPAILIATILSIFIAAGILVSVQAVLIGFGHVLIPLYVQGWEIFAAMGVLIIGFLIVYYLSSRELKNTNLVHAFE